MVERALAAADAAEVEAQRRKAAVHEGVVELVDDLVVHRPAKLRVRMQDDRDRGVLLPGRVVAALDAAGRAGENDFRHLVSTSGGGRRLKPASRRPNGRFGLFPL